MSRFICMYVFLWKGTFIPPLSIRHNHKRQLIRIRAYLHKNCLLRFTINVFFFMTYDDHLVLHPDENDSIKEKMSIPYLGGRKTVIKYIINCY